MTNKEMVELLKKEAQNNPAANAIFHVFALRQRARNSVSILGLKQSMKSAGFDFTRAEYIKVLRFLATLGIGRLDTDPRGKVRALKDVRITLQSIGESACGSENIGLKYYKERNKFVDLPSQQKYAQVPKPEVIAPTASVSPMTLNAHLKLTLIINDKELQIELPKGFTAQETALLISSLNNRESA